MSRTKKVISVIFLVILLCIIYILKFTESTNYIRFAFTVYDSKLENFDKYKNDYQLIADKVIELRDKGKISIDDNYVYVGEGVMQSGFDGSEIQPSVAEKNSLLNIESIFYNEAYALNKIRFIIITL